MKDLEPAEPVRRYEYADPGGLIHIAIKKLGRFDRKGCHCDLRTTGRLGMTGMDSRASEGEIDRLRSLGLEELRRECRRLNHGEPPRISRDLLVLALGYRLQEIEHGGQHPHAKKPGRDCSSQSL